MKQGFLQDFFTTREHAILAKYFGMQNLRPKEASDPGLLEERDPEEWNEKKKGLAVLSGYNETGPYIFDPETPEEDFISQGDPFPSPLEAAVARYCLGKVHTPEKGSIEKSAKQGRQIEVHHIGTVDWGGGGYGSSWPEAYAIAKVPYYNRWVVIGLRDSSDPVGYDEYAIFQTSSEEPIKVVAQKAIQRYWKHSLSFNQPVFGSIITSGLLSSGELGSIANSVWSDSDVPNESYDDFTKRTGFDLQKEAENRRQAESEGGF